MVVICAEHSAHAQRIYCNIERDCEWIVAYSAELPDANGQGHTREEALESLRDAIAIVLEDRREDGLRGVPDSAERTVVTVE